MPPPPKADAPSKSPAKPEAAPEPVVAAGVSSPAAPPRGLKPWLPALAVLLLAPVATWATVEFVVVPRLRQKLAVATSGEKPAEATPPAGKAGKTGKDGKESAPTYEFQNVVVNLAGTMGTRYLKTSFLITGADANIKGVFEAAKPKLTDVTLNVLSSLTLADLEEPGAKNVIREKLVAAYNQALGRKVAEQVYFSDFVIQ